MVDSLDGDGSIGGEIGACSVGALLGVFSFAIDSIAGRHKRFLLLVNQLLS